MTRGISGPFFLGSHVLNRTGTGLSGVAFGGTGGHVFWDEIGVRTGRLNFSRLQAADPVVDADGWTVEDNGSVTVGTDAPWANYSRAYASERVCDGSEVRSRQLSSSG